MEECTVYDSSRVNSKINNYIGSIGTINISINNNNDPNANKARKLQISDRVHFELKPVKSKNTEVNSNEIIHLFRNNKHTQIGDNFHKKMDKISELSSMQFLTEKCNINLQPNIKEMITNFASDFSKEMSYSKFAQKGGKTNGAQSSGKSSSSNYGSTKCENIKEKTNINEKNEEIFSFPSHYKEQNQKNEMSEQLEKEEIKKLLFADNFIMGYLKDKLYKSILQDLTNTIQEKNPNFQQLFQELFNKDQKSQPQPQQEEFFGNSRNNYSNEVETLLSKKREKSKIPKESKCNTDCPHKNSKHYAKVF
jgi:hypothetical protein